MALAQRIRRARRIAGLSQQTLASKLGVTRSAVSNWESADSVQPTTGRLALLASALRVSFEWIATGRGEMRFAADCAGGSEAEGSLVNCPHELHLLHLYRYAPPRVKALLQEVANLHAPPQACLSSSAKQHSVVMRGGGRALEKGMEADERGGAGRGAG